MPEWIDGEKTRIANGLCPVCGLPPDEDGWANCQTCKYKLCHECSIDPDYFRDGRCYYCLEGT